MVQFCAKRGLYVENTYFKYKNIPKCTRVARIRHGIYIMSTVLIERDMLKYVYDVKITKGMGRGISDHFVVLS